MELPAGARKFGVQFRWWQPYHSGRGVDVWALDEISMTSVLFNTISLDFSNVLDVTQSLGFYLGHVQPYCQHDWTLRYRYAPSGLGAVSFIYIHKLIQKPLKALFFSFFFKLFNLNC